MAKKKERTELNKENWVSSFNLVGEVKVNDNTFQLDQQSEKSDWCYNRFNVGIDCGEKHGTVYAQAMGGYGINRENLVYVHGKDDNGNDDFSNQYTLDWDDRNDETLLKDVGRRCFYTVAIEQDTKGNLVYMNFLSQYDMIQYLSEHLEDGMTVSVSGDLSYQEYNGNLNVQKDIRRITLIKDLNPDNYRATFMQSILVDKDSKGEVDKEKEVLYVDAYILEWFKEYNGVSLAKDGKKGGLVPLKKTFEYKLKMDNPEQTKKAVTRLFKPKKGVAQITFHGEFVESGATTKVTLDDIPDDIKEMIALGIYTEEEALTECATNGSRERRMILTIPYIKKVTGKDGEVTTILQIFDEKYDEDDLILPCLEKKEFEDVKDEEVPDDFMNIPDDAGDDIDWLNDI